MMPVETICLFFSFRLQWCVPHMYWIRRPRRKSRGVPIPRSFSLYMYMRRIEMIVFTDTDREAVTPSGGGNLARQSHRADMVSPSHQELRQCPQTPSP